MLQKLRRWLCLLLALWILPVSLQAAGEELSYLLTGNQAADIVGIALTQVGYSENKETGASKFGAYYGDDTGAWCGYFVSWCAEKAEIPANVIPRMGSTSAFLSYYRAAGRFYSLEDAPCQTGDLIFFDWGGDGVTDHMGIVQSTDGKGDIHLVDGNYSNRVNDRVLPKDGSEWTSVVGFARPDYQTVAQPQPKPEPTPDPQPGDLNRDGVASLADVVLLRRLILQGEEDPLGDLSGDGACSLADVVLLRRIVLS